MIRMHRSTYACRCAHAAAHKHIVSATYTKSLIQPGVVPSCRYMQQLGLCNSDRT
jgi:hypothetical protein